MNPRIAIIRADVYDVRTEINASRSGKTILVISESRTPKISKMAYIINAEPTNPIDPKFGNFPKKRRYRDTLPWTPKRKR